MESIQTPVPAISEALPSGLNHQGVFYSKKDSELTWSRRAANAINELIRHIGLGTLGERFDGEVSEEWTVYDDHVVALKGTTRVAEVWFEDDHVDVIVPDCYELIRSSHLKAFKPSEFGITVQTAKDFKGDKIKPDLKARFQLNDPIGLHLPRQPVERSVRHRAVKVVRAL